MGDMSDDFAARFDADPVLAAYANAEFERNAEQAYDRHADDGHSACQYCWHRLDAHNDMAGCQFCTCLASHPEARPHAGTDLQRLPLSEYHCRTGYGYADPSERARCHRIKPLDPTKWCSKVTNHTGGHSYTPIPKQYRRSRKDADTMAKKLSEIENELRVLANQEEVLAARKAELQRLKDARLALPQEPDLDAVIKFRVQFDPHGITYSFVATRTRRNGAQWYTTSSQYPGPYTWDALLELMQRDIGVKTGGATLEFFLYEDAGKWVR